ncbi:branched-chain amino acid ABC transporter permease [Nocardioides soli]|uniref:ABC-type branched-subunit amino acid transport system permease subunit n=1 Tax=Nocardioides soli TaxID=1036020 RepID=A0A7W4W1E6_9ACTN|nr:branched-chain amino acid ABC transporter permease [Nocardioides soli]MBB3045358.1 ABC-type branched-subunit amino acid transport system permease subunit [Nocardioides soli]
MMSPSMLLRSGGLVAVLAFAVAAPLMVSSRYDLGVLQLALINALLVLGFNFTVGFTRRLSLGHIGFFAIGAYASALLTTEHDASPLVAMAVGVLIASAAALVVSVLTNGLHAHYLTLATLGFGVIVQVVATNWIDLTGGSNGVLGIPVPTAFGIELVEPEQQYYLALALLAAGAALMARIRSTKLGRQAAALRQSERAAESLGIRTDRIKTLTLVLSAAYGAVAGSLYAHTYGYVAPDAFSFALMLTVLAMLVVGGPGTIAGPILGAVILTYLPEMARVGDEFWQLIYGVLLFVMVLWVPKGLAGLAQQAIALARRPPGRSASRPATEAVAR